MLRLAVVAAAARAAEECASRDGVFFSAADFPSTGDFANQRSSPRELEARIAAWTVPYVPGLGPLTEAQHAQFFRDGWVIVPDLVPREALEGAIASVEALVDSIAQITGEVYRGNPDAKFSKVFQEEYRGMSKAQKEASPFDSDMSDDDDF